MRAYAALGLCLFAVVLAPAQNQDPLLNPGFVHFYNNEYDQALGTFETQAKQFPKDPNRYNYVAQAILYREMYRDGALESQLVSGNNPFLRHPKMEVSAADKAEFGRAISQAVALSQVALRANPKDGVALNALAVSHGLRANYLFLVEKSWMEALHESVESRKANDEILKIDPEQVDAHLLHGLSEYIVGCLPGYLRLLAAVDGFHGNKEEGIRQLQLVARTGVSNRYDASILLAAIYRRERRPQDALPLLEILAHQFPRNYLFRFEQVQMYSDAGNKEAALRVLAEIEKLRCDHAPGFGQLLPEKVLYLRGNLLFWYGDEEAALKDLRQVTAHASELDLSTAVMSWLREGQVLDLEDHHQQAVDAYRQAVTVAPKSEAALEAKAYIAKPYQQKQKSH